MKWDDLTEDQKDVVIETTANAVGDALDCMRVWSAWSYGTMGEDDFLPVRDSNERLVDIARAVVESLPEPATQAVPWEPRDQWPTAVQVEAWHGRGGWLMALHGPVVLRVDHERDVIYAERDDGDCVRVWSSRSNLSAFGLMPTREGRPVAWAEVDAAIAAMEVKDV